MGGDDRRQRWSRVASGRDGRWGRAGWVSGLARSRRLCEVVVVVGGRSKEAKGHDMLEQDMPAAVDGSGGGQFGCRDDGIVQRMRLRGSRGGGMGFVVAVAGGGGGGG